MSELGDMGIVGAGFMGSGIAESVARAGGRVRLFEPGQAALDRSEGRIERSVAHAVERGKLDDAQAQELLGRISFHTDMDALAASSVVVEAVVEDPEVKGPIFRALDGLLAEDAVLASNTSSIPIAQLASWTQHRERVLGLHFFSPVPVMKLVEVVVGLDTSDTAVARAEGFAQAIGKTAI